MYTWEEVLRMGEEIPERFWRRGRRALTSTIPQHSVYIGHDGFPKAWS